MMTVKEVSRLTGVSIRTLRHYDAIGLLKPTQLTAAKYRLYDAQAIERLYMILLFRELDLPLKQIHSILDAPDFDRDRVLMQQVQLMQHKIDHLQNRIALANGLRIMGVNNMNFNDFDAKKIHEYGQQAKALYGKTDAYQEFEKKSAKRTAAQERQLGDQVMDFFDRLGKMRPCAPDSAEAQAWVQQLQAFFTEHYYTCTPQILKGLAESYAGGGAMTENIDRAGGAGTGAFAKEIIDIYVAKVL